MRGSCRFSLIFLLTAGTTTALCAERPAPAVKPNILFIMVDEMKWNVKSCGGQEIARTPHLDRLAREGTRFDTAYTVAPICTPSRYSFFNSRYAHVHGCTDNSSPPREPQVLLPVCSAVACQGRTAGVRQTGLSSC